VDKEGEIRVLLFAFKALALCDTTGSLWSGKVHHRSQPDANRA